MQDDKNGKNIDLEVERLLMFVDAVVAIAITLLALELKVEPSEDGHFTFGLLLGQWQIFLAFFLSFINIANFWKTHYEIFNFVHRNDERFTWLNVLWLLGIVLLPFSTGLLSHYFSDPPAMCVYAFNLLAISVLQNMIWQYGVQKFDLDLEKTGNEALFKNYQLFFRLDMANAFLGLVCAFFSPIWAFVVLFFKVPTIVFAIFYLNKRKEKIALLRATEEWTSKYIITLLKNCQGGRFYF